MQLSKKECIKGYSFCEEYIITADLALILKNKSYDGISYNSTKNYGKDTESSGDDYKDNIAIITKLDSEHIYDRQLYDKIQLTVPIDISKIDIITKEDVEELLKEI